MDDSWKAKKNYPENQERQARLRRKERPLERQACSFYQYEMESAYCYEGRKMLVHQVQEKVWADYGHSAAPAMLIPFRVTEREEIRHYLELAPYLEEVPVDESIFFIMHAADYLLDATYQTLVFYADGFILKTNESTSTIMNRLFAKIGLRYDRMRSLLSILEGKNCHCRPYVYGNFCFLPVNGPTKQAVTWINLSHLTCYRKVPGDKQKVRLDFHNRHTVDALMRYQSFEKHIETASQSYAKQHRYFLKLSKLMGYDLLKSSHPFMHGILYQRMEMNKPAGAMLNPEQLLKKAHQVLWRDFLKLELLRAHPFYEEVNETLEQKYFSEDLGKKSPENEPE